MLRNARHLILAALCGILFVLCLAWIGLEGFSWQLAFSAVLLLLMEGISLRRYRTDTTQEQLAAAGDERDHLVAMKSCQTALRLANDLLFAAGALCLFLHIFFGGEAFFLVGGTLWSVMILLFVLVLAANQYHEKRE